MLANMFAEYIGQLEGEVALKAQEANDLRVQNRQLAEENTRLTDLTRMLLSSQAFSGFLNELSQNGLPAPTITVAPQPQPLPQPTRKDVNPNQGARQVRNQQMQVGMTMIPETTVDFSMLDSNNWNSMNSFQVCAVTEVPEGPVIDTSFLSGKNSTFSAPLSSTSKDCPVLETPPVFQNKNVTESATIVDPDVELDEVAFTLFVDEPKSANVTSVTVEKQSIILPSYKSLYPQFILTDAVSDDQAWATLESMCSALDATCEQLSALTSHLS